MEAFRRYTSFLKFRNPKEENNPRFKPYKLPFSFQIPYSTSILLITISKFSIPNYESDVRPNILLNVTIVLKT